MNGIEAESLRFKHMCARFNPELQLPLARVRRAEQHQQTLVNWLHPPDQSALETTIGYEQVAIELTACLANPPPGPDGSAAPISARSCLSWRPAWTSATT